MIKPKKPSEYYDYDNFFDRYFTQDYTDIMSKFN